MYLNYSMFIEYFAMVRGKVLCKCSILLKYLISRFSDPVEGTKVPGLS